MENLSCLTFVLPLSMPWTDNYFILCVFGCIEVCDYQKHMANMPMCYFTFICSFKKHTYLTPTLTTCHWDTEESKISSLASSCSQMKGWDDKQIMTNKHVGQASHWGALGVVREVMSEQRCEGWIEFFQAVWEGKLISTMGKRDEILRCYVKRK